MGKGKLKKRNPGQNNEGEAADGEKKVTSTQEVAADGQPTKNEQSEKTDEPADTATGNEAAATGGKVENEKSGEKHGLKRKRIKNKNKKKKPGQNGNDSKKPQASSGGKDELAGLIFMCSSATKQDCFRYRVFGLPSGKRELVEKVTRGMRLFLYDFDQRLLYGIFKASGRGGFELEPNAFRSSDRKFPAQVRFRIQKDCLPLPEDKFKAAIKENYYGKNKFKFELNAQQVKNLSQLFRSVPLSSRGPREGNLGRPGPRREYDNFADDIVLQREARLKRQYREDSRRVPHGDYIPQVPLYGPDAGIPERELLRHAPVGDPYVNVQGPDPYGPLYQRQQLVPVDPLPGREGLIPELDYHGRDPQLDLLYQQRLELDLRKRRLEEAAYLDEIKKSYAPLGSEYGDPYLYRDPLRRADLVSASTGPAIPHPSVIGPSPGYRY